MGNVDLSGDIERVALAEATPQEAISILRGICDADPTGFARRAYVALKSAVLHILTARRTLDLPEWVDLLRQSSGLAKAQGSEALGERLLALSDLATDHMRIAEAHPLEAVLSRPHVRDILDTLWKHGGRAEREQVRAAVNIGTANLSRILGTLEAVGLIERDNRRVRTITLTADARHRLFAMRQAAAA